MIDPANHASTNACRKLVLSFLKQALVDGHLTNIYTLVIGDTGR
jgi:hypothetical protein